MSYWIFHIFFIVIINNAFIFSSSTADCWSTRMIYTRSPYAAPSWTNGALKTAAVPSERIHLGQFPTPMHRWSPPGYENFNVWLKRDDLSSFDLSGNKVRKLEFLMAKAVQEGYDSVVTIGGIQSNHARATACCARQLGLEPHLILRTPQPDNDPGLVGNLLLDRLVGAKLHLVSTSNYARIGGTSLLAQLERDLLAAGRRPFLIPVGGSDPLGAWGYLEAVKEMIDQQQSLGMDQFDHIVFACGSGGTATGLALGSRLAGLRSKIHAVGVCDSPDYFYDHIDATSASLGVNNASIGGARNWCTVYNGAGTGYARSTTEELEYIYAVSRTTGIIFDPVYSGKALYYFSKEENRAAAGFSTGDSILFIHTGGTFGLYDKSEQLLVCMLKMESSNCTVYDDLREGTIPSDESVFKSVSKLKFSAT